MKHILSLLILIAFTCSSVYAQVDTPSYLQHINPERLIIKFKQELTKAEREAVFCKISGQNMEYFDLPDLGLTIVKTGLSPNTDQQVFEDLLETCYQQKEIGFTGFFLQSKEGHQVGILDKLFFKLKSEQSFSSPRFAHFLKKHATLKDVYEGSANSAKGILSVMNWLQQNPDVIFAEPNYLVNPIVHSTDDPLLDDQWALENNGPSTINNGIAGADMSVVDTWTITMGDPNIKIAVMDSGVDTLHPDLINNLLPGYDAFNTGTNGYPTPNYPEDAHGTHCAGILAAEADNGIGIAGVAPDCSLIPIRMFFYADTILGIIPFSTSEVLAEGIRWAWEDGGSDIQSHSWSLPDIYLQLGFPSGNPALVDAAIQDATTLGRNGKGCLLFFSSGNENADAANWPGRLPSVMSVTATSMCDERKSPTSCDLQEWGGNYGTDVDFGAPGVDVYATDMVGPLGVYSADYRPDFGGTSASCPNAAGVAALMLSVDASLNLNEYRQILSEGCDKVGGYAYDSLAVYGGWSQELGYGRINAWRAVAPLAGITAVEEANEEIYTLYPNPADEMLTINFNHPLNETLDFHVINVAGQLVEYIQLSADTEQYQLSTIHLADGVYFITIKTAISTSSTTNGFFTKKVLIAH